MDKNPPVGCGAFANVHEGSYRGNRVAVKRLLCPVSREVSHH